MIGRKRAGKNQKAKGGGRAGNPRRDESGLNMTNVAYQPPAHAQLDGGAVHSPAQGGSGCESGSAGDSGGSSSSPSDSGCSSGGGDSGGGGGGGFD